MSTGPARVDSFEAMKRFRAVMVRMAEVIDKGLTEAEVEIQSTLEWLKHDQTAYWNAQARKCEEKYRQARMALQSAKTRQGPLSGGQSLVDERKALAQAERKLAEARDKQAKVKSWIIRLEQEAYNYKGAVQGARQTVEGDIPRAVATLDRMLDALEDYVRVSVPYEQRGTGATGGESVMRRPKGEPFPPSDSSGTSGTSGTEETSAGAEGEDEDETGTAGNT